MISSKYVRSDRKTWISKRNDLTSFATTSFIHHCFICRPLGSEPRTDVVFALTQWQFDALSTLLDLIHPLFRLSAFSYFFLLLESV